MIGRTPRFAAVAATAALLGALSACSNSSAEPDTTVTVVVTPTQNSSGTSASTATSTTPPSSPASSPPAHATTLPGDCNSLLSTIVIEPALGHPIAGKTEFVVGKAEKDIGRLAYINCRYAVTKGNQAPPLEIGVSLYNTDAQASQRIPATASDYVNHGATQATTTVGGQQAQILTGGTGKGYAEPTLVMAADQRTIAITLNDPKTKAANVKTVLTKIAAVVLKQTQPKS